MSSHTHITVNPSWRCQLTCSYCWLPHTKINREGRERTPQEWIAALTKVLRAGDVVVFSGGEPTIYKGFVDVLMALGKAEIRWAFTTNGQLTPIIEDIIARRPPYCVGINVSDHATNEKARSNYDKLYLAGFPLAVNTVMHPAAGNSFAGEAKYDITYQDWEHGKGVDGKARLCSAGIQHWAVDPTGEVWRCMVAMQTGQPSLGNLMECTYKPQMTRRLCTFGCSTCYTEEPANWLVQMKDWEAA